MARKSWRDLNPRRRINRKLTGSTVDLRKPPSTAERAALSRKRSTISAIQRGELHVVKPRSAKMSRSLKAVGAKRLKGSRLLVPDRRQSFDDYLNSIGYTKDYSGHQNVKLAYLNKRGELKYVTVSGRRWEAVVQWKVAAANEYDDLITDFKMCGLSMMKAWRSMSRRSRVTHDVQLMISCACCGEVRPCCLWV